MGSATILYIEDNPTNFRLVERILTSEGYRVLHAEDGLEGIKKAIEERAGLDLILMDINLPGFDGYEATARLRSIPGFDNIPILAVTVNTLQGDRSRSLAAGCDGYIAKPIDLSTFAGEIRDFLSGKREILPPEEETRYLREHNKKLVERLEMSLASLEQTKKSAMHTQKLANVGEMASGLMHELRSPLSSISFMAEYLLTSSTDDENRAKYLSRIVDNVTRIQSLSLGINSFVRPSADQKGYADIATAIDEVLTLSEHELKDQAISVRLSLEEPLPHIWAAEGQFHHIFMNLIRNAAQAIAKARREEPPESRRASEITVVAYKERSGQKVAVEVGDNGTGVPDELKPRLFEPFFTTKPRGEGTGLGLHIVAQVMDDLGGSIEVGDSAAGGALFRLRFPVAKAGSALKGMDN